MVYVQYNKQFSQFHIACGSCVPGKIFTECSHWCTKRVVIAHMRHTISSSIHFYFTIIDKSQKLNEIKYAKWNVLSLVCLFWQNIWHLHRIPTTWYGSALVYSESDLQTYVTRKSTETRQNGNLYTTDVLGAQQIKPIRFFSKQHVFTLLLISAWIFLFVRTLCIVLISVASHILYLCLPSRNCYRDKGR